MSAEIGSRATKLGCVRVVCTALGATHGCVCVLCTQAVPSPTVWTSKLTAAGVVTVPNPALCPTATVGAQGRAQSLEHCANLMN